MNRRSKIVDDTGYTLIEIVMVIVILGVIGAFTFQFVAHGVQAFKKSSARKDLYDQGRLALERMVRELRDTKEVTDSSTSKITFKKAHPAQAADNIEEVKFELVGSDLKRVGDPNGTPVTAVLASNVDSFQVGGVGCCSAVTVDNTSSEFTDGGSSIMVSHATSGTYRLMLVGVSLSPDANETVTGVTYNGTALALAGTVTNSNDARVEIWSLVAPDTGTHNVVVTFSAALNQQAIAGVMTFNGVDQSTPLSAFYSTQGDDTAAASLDISSAEGEFVYGLIAVEYDAVTAGTGYDEQWNVSVSGTKTNGAGGTTNCGAETVTMSWNLVAEASPYNHWAIGGVSIKPTAAVAESIAFDNASSATTSNSNSLTFSHAIGSDSNRILLVGVSIEHNATGPAVTSITYDGQALAKIDAQEVGSGYIGRAELWYLLEADLPSTGSYSVVVTTSATCEDLSAGAISLAYVAQQAAEATAKGSNEGPDTITTNITTLTDGAWIVDVIENGEPNVFSPNAGQIERFDQTATSSDCAGSTKPVATAASTSMGWSASANRMAHVAAAFAPATVAATCTSTVGDLLTLELTLSSSDGGTVKMRTKVYLRNLP